MGTIESSFWTLMIPLGGAAALISIAQMFVLRRWSVRLLLVGVTGAIVFAVAIEKIALPPA